MVGFNYRVILVVIVFLGTSNFYNVNAECIVRNEDCSYAISVPTQRGRSRDGGTSLPLSNVVLEGSPVEVFEQGTWKSLPCQKVTQTDNSSWVIDYKDLKLHITNHRRHDSHERVCTVTFTTTRDIRIGGGNNIDGVVTTFPSFWMKNETDSSHISHTSQLDGRLSWHGAFVRPQLNGRCSTGVRGGPCVLFQRNNPAHGTSVILSALDHFLVTTQITEYPTILVEPSSTSSYFENSELVWGASTAGSIDILPQGYSHSFVIVFSQDGVTDTVAKWGEFLRNYYNLKERMSDLTIQTLGYQTDEGAQYCHCEENCDTALLEVMGNLRWNHQVPIRYLSYQNAWWPSSWSAYWCVSDWRTWNLTRVPMGVPEFSRRVNLPLQLYSPYFCNDTTYDNANFTFLVSNTSLSRK